MTPLTPRRGVGKPPASRHDGGDAAPALGPGAEARPDRDDLVVSVPGEMMEKTMGMMRKWWKTVV